MFTLWICFALMETHILEGLEMKRQVSCFKHNYTSLATALLIKAFHPDDKRHF